MSLQEKFDKAKELPESGRAEALKAIVLGSEGNDADGLKVKEAAITEICSIYVSQANGEALRALLVELRPLFAAMPKAKTAKIVRSIIDVAAKIPGTTSLQLDMCKEQVEWARTEKRSFLRQRIELRLATLYMETREFQPALTLISSLLSEVKRLDDKILLVDIYLLESRVQHILRNLPRAKASLTAARSAANSVYIPPLMQADIDLQSGTLHAEDKDYKTGYSYYFEAFEQLQSLNDPRASQALKYMLLCKVMSGSASEVPSIIQSKAGARFVGPEVDSIKAVAHAHQERSLALFQKATQDYRPQLVEDRLVSVHLDSLYDTLLEGNLARLVEPYSRVEVSYLASLIELPVGDVERKLSQMILDKSLRGTIDQGAGCLEVFEDEEADRLFPAALEVFDNMGKVVDTLFRRSQKIVV